MRAIEYMGREVMPTEPRGVESIQEYQIIPREPTLHRTKDTVDMNDGKWGDKTAQLHNYGLGGCDSVLVYTSKDGKDRQGILTHYDPTSILAHGKKLEELISQHPIMKEATKKEAIIFYGENNNDNKLALDYLESVLKADLGGDTNIQRKAYWEVSRCGDPYHDGIMYFVGEAKWVTSKLIEWEGRFE